MKQTILLSVTLLAGILASVTACARAAPASAPALTHTVAASTVAASTPTMTAPPAVTGTPASTATAAPAPATVAATAAATAAATGTDAPSATPSSSPAATATSGAAADIATTGAFLSLSVADVKASAQWYADKLGLKVVLQPAKTNGASVVVLEGGGLIVELIQMDGSQPLTAVAPAIKDKLLVQGIVKVGAIVENFDQTVALLRARHVTIVLGPYPASAEQRANIIVQDNDGNLIQFFGK